MKILDTSILLLVLLTFRIAYSELIEMEGSKYGSIVYDTETNYVNLRPVVRTEFEKYSSREIIKNEISLEVLIKSDKTSYKLNEPIILTITLTYTGKDTIRLFGLTEPFYELYDERIGRFVSEDSLEVEYSILPLALVSYTKNALIELSAGESYEVNFQLNLRDLDYPRDEFFGHIDKYVYSLDLARVVWLKEEGEYTKIDQFIWQSNEIEFGVMESTPCKSDIIIDGKDFLQKDQEDVLNEFKVTLLSNKEQQHSAGGIKFYIRIHNISKESKEISNPLDFIGLFLYDESYETELPSFQNRLLNNIKSGELSEISMPCKILSVRINSKQLTTKEISKIHYTLNPGEIYEVGFEIDKIKYRAQNENILHDIQKGSYYLIPSVYISHFNDPELKHEKFNFHKQIITLK